MKEVFVAIGWGIVGGIVLAFGISAYIEIKERMKK